MRSVRANERLKPIILRFEELRIIEELMLDVDELNDAEERVLRKVQATLCVMRRAYSKQVAPQEHIARCEACQSGKECPRGYKR